MKKVLLGLVALSAVSMAADINPTNVVLKAGVDVFTRTKPVKDEGKSMTKKKNEGFKGELAVEATQVITDEFELGLGVAWQNHGKMKTKSDFVTPGRTSTVVQMRSYPVYAIAKYNIPVDGDFKPFIYANLGYSFNNGKKTHRDGTDIDKYKYEDGMYYGVGVGVEKDNFIVDLGYKLNKGKVKYTSIERGAVDRNEKAKADYSRVSLGFGYKFSF